MSQEHLERFFNMSLDMLCVCSSEGYFLRVNPAFTRILGYSPEELLSKPYTDFVHPDDRRATSDITLEIAGGTPTEYFENRYRCKDGFYRWIAWTSSGAVDADGFFYGVGRDITEQKEQAATRENLVQRLQASLEKIRTLEGLLPTCSWCHRIRDEGGNWDQMEKYIEKRTDAAFTHGICPECLERNFRKG
jgi:PAS domain S-box-containing protein